MVLYTGLQASYKFGFGVIDSVVMVTSERQQSVPIQLSQKITPGAIISEIFIVNSEITFLEQLALVFNMSFVGISQDDYNQCVNKYYYNGTMWPQRGRVAVNLVSPSGTTSTLLPFRLTDMFPGTYDNWPLLSTHFWGEDPKGIWTIFIQSSTVGTISVQVPEVILYGLSQVPAESVEGSALCDGEKANSDAFGANFDATSTQFGVN